MPLDLTRPLDVPQKGNREKVLRQNTRAESTLRREKMVPVARREEPPKAIRAIGTVLGAPLVGLALAGQAADKVISKPIDAYNRSRYRRPLTIQEMEARRQARSVNPRREQVSQK